MRSSRHRWYLLLLMALTCLSLTGRSGILFTQTGSAHGIPRGHQKMAKSVCIEVTSEERHGGDVTRRKVNSIQFEVSFPGSKYTITNGAGKFAPDWTQIRIYTCNWGGEYWLLRRGV